MLYIYRLYIKCVSKKILICLEECFAWKLLVVLVLRKCFTFYDDDDNVNNNNPFTLAYF